MDWFALLRDLQGTSKSLLQHHYLKASILWCSEFFVVHLSHPHMIPGKTIALIRCTFVGKVLSLLFNMLSRFLIAFLPRSKCLLISQLQSLSTVILEPKKIKYATISTFSTSVCHEVMELDAMTSSQLFHPPLSLSSRKLFSPSLHPAIRVVLSAYLRLLIFLPAILIPAWDSSSLAFRILYSAYKLNK